MGGATPTLRRLRADYKDANALAADLTPFAQDVTNTLASGLTIDNMNGIVASLDIVAPVRVVTPTLAGAWAASTAVGYSKDAFGIVRLQGVLTGGTYSNSTAVFTLPSAYWPAVALTFPAAQSSLFEPAGEVTIGTDGKVLAPVIVSVQSGTSTYLSLDGITFQASDPGAVLPAAPFPLVVDCGNLRSTPISMFVLSCADLTNGSPVAAEYPGLLWQPNGDGTVSILDFPGLAAGRRYVVRVEIRGY